MRKEIRTALLVAVLSILFCVGVSAKAGSMSLFGKAVSEQEAGVAGVKDQADQQAAVTSKKDRIEVEGTIIEMLPNAVSRVELQDGQQMLAHLSGKLRMNFIRIHIGDKVIVEMPSDGQSMGRIIWRYK